jgi:hypothetical protein
LNSRAAHSPAVALNYWLNKPKNDPQPQEPPAPTEKNDDASRA